MSKEERPEEALLSASDIKAKFGFPPMKVSKLVRYGLLVPVAIEKRPGVVRPMRVFRESDVTRLFQQQQQARDTSLVSIPVFAREVGVSDYKVRAAVARGNVRGVCLRFVHQGLFYRRHDLLRALEIPSAPTDASIEKTEGLVTTHHACGILGVTRQRLNQLKLAGRIRPVCRRKVLTTTGCTCVTDFYTLSDVEALLDRKSRKPGRPRVTPSCPSCGARLSR